MFKNTLHRLRRFFKKEYQYVYVFSLDTISFENKAANIEENKRIKILNLISDDLRKHKKIVKSTDNWIDTKDYLTYFFLFSDEVKENIYFTPLLYELYAFLKTKSERFSYKTENLIFKDSKKDVKILKFTIEC